MAMTEHLLGKKFLAQGEEGKGGKQKASAVRRQGKLKK